MNFLDKLERKLGRIAIPNITLYLVMGQAFFYVAAYSGRLDVGRMLLIPSLVLSGEWWRLLAFVFIPPSTSLIFVFFALYFFYMMGTALEGHWGTFRYNLFLLIGYLITVAVSFLVPYGTGTNIFLGASVFLAFAHLYPEFVIYIFFVLPVKIKWLALLTWIGYGWQLIAGDWMTRVLVIASIGNYLLFFGKDIALRTRYGGRKMASQARDIAKSREPFHRCTVCGKSDLSHPDMEFRYCPDCGGLGYCMEHIMNHEHRSKKG
jgi:membrane associated rhomboid family serine protease